MKRKEKYKRISISVSRELKAKIDEMPEINWSAVAQEAFEHIVRIPRRDWLIVTLKDNKRNG